MSEASIRSEFAPDIDLPADADRVHGTGIDADAFTDLDRDTAERRLRELSRAERMEVLFGFEPFDYQRDLIDHCESAAVTRVAIKPGRQVGKTLTGGALAAHEAATTPGEDVLIAAPFQETADEMMRVAKRLLKTADDRLEAMGMSLGAPAESRNKREWEFDHGGRLLSRTLGVDGVGQRGKNPKFVIVDEAAYAPDSVYEDVIEPFFLTHDDYTFILSSTPSGDAGYFYEKVAVDGDWHAPHWPSAICPLVDPDWLAEKREKTEARTFRQEYLGEFIGSSDRFFSPALVDDITEPGTAPETHDLVALGADIARAGDDWTAIAGIDSRGVAGILHSDPDMTLTEATGKLTALYDEHGPDRVLVDETGLGAGVVEMLEQDISHRAVEGVKFTLDRKQSLYNGLKSAMEAGDIRLGHHPRLGRELKKLTYATTRGGKTKISAPGNGHDDHPDALALAVDGWRGGTSSGDVLAFELEA